MKILKNLKKDERKKERRERAREREKEMKQRIIIKRISPNEQYIYIIWVKKPLATAIDTKQNKQESKRASERAN